MQSAFFAASAKFARNMGPKVAKVGAGTFAFSALAIPTAHANSASLAVTAPESSAPPFSMDRSKYDQSTYSGRLFNIFEMIDPRTLLTTEAEVKRAQALLEEFQKTGKIPASSSNDEMWQARGIVDSCVHPITKEMMFAPGRMSAFVPMNVPICALMLNARTTPMVIFSQWINQTYNVMNNYINRSSLEVDWAGLLKPYVLAVSVSCSIALGLRKAMTVAPGLAKFGLFVPYLAVISAGSCNVAFTRMDEWAGRGVLVCSPEGKELGMSVNAGQQAVFSTVSTRSCCLPIPVLIVPPLVMAALPVTGTAAMVTEMFVILGCISCALPCALAILPQEMRIPTSKLEAEFQNLKDATGKPITEVIANKGL